MSWRDRFSDPNIMSNNLTTYPTFTTREERQTKRERQSEQLPELLKPPCNRHFCSLKLPKPCSRDFTHPTLFLDIHFAKMVKSRGGKTLGESSSKEQTHATGSPTSVRRTRRAVAEENTLSTPPEKREKMKKLKKSQKVQQNVILIMKLLSLDCVFDG